MAYSYVRYSGNGSTTNYTFSFPTISTDHIKVRVNGTLVTNWSFLSSSTIQFAAAPANAAVIEIRRETPKDSAIVNFTDGSVLLERDLDLLATWQLYVAQETEDDLEDTIRVDSQGRFDALNKRIINVADPVNAQDAVTKTWAETGMSSQLAQATAQATASAGSATASAGSASAAATSASNASTSATNAATSATGASTSATAASGSATAAANSATAAGTSATNANTSALAAASSATSAAGSAITATTEASNAAASAVNAANSAAAAATALDNFDDRYLGQKATDPSVDNDGNALITGALYYNTTDSAMRVYTGTGWINASSAQVATMKTYVYVATAAQTTFSGNDANGSSLTYVAPYLIVSLNGLELRPVVDYTATSGLSVVLTVAATAGDELQVQAFSGFNVANIQSANVNYQQGGTGSTVRSVDAKLKEFVSVKDFGAQGDNITDDTLAVQQAIDSLSTTGGVVYFPPGTYRIARNIGTNDRWGIKITSSNITLKGDRAFLRRFNTDISTYANAYPILFVGVPDSNVASLTTNIVIDSLNFIGENSRHNVVGSSLTDFRNVIEFKNTSDTWVKDCKFTSIDSMAINYQFPASYDYVNNQYFNTTKNYRSKISGCSFIAAPHATPGRALLHCIVVGGIDYCNIVNNYFEWCDCCVSGETQYNRYTNTENDTFTRTEAAALGALRRCGRNIVVANNTIHNSSEHSFYMALMDVSITGNNIRTDNPTICNTDPIKIRSRGATVVGNVISNYPVAITINEPSMDVTVSGNVCMSSGSLDGGVIDINSDGIKSYIDNRPFFYVGGAPDYQPMRNISIVGNTITFPSTSVTAVGGRQVKDVAFRVYTDAFSASFPDGQIQSIVISNNTIKNHNVGFYFIGAQYKGMAISGNTLHGKEFTMSGFNASTTLNTYAVMQCLGGGSTDAMWYTTFTGNNVHGATYLFASDNAGGGAGTMHVPRGITGNQFSYVKNIRTADMRSFALFSRFRDNAGVFFLDRTWPGTALENALGDGTLSSSYDRYCTQWDGTALRFYTNDTSTFITL